MNLKGVVMANPNGINAGNTFRKVQAYDELLNTDISYPFIREGQ